MIALEGFIYVQTQIFGYVILKIVSKMIFR